MSRELENPAPERRSAAERFVALDAAAAGGTAPWTDDSDDSDAALARCSAAVAIARGLADDPELRWAYDEAAALASGAPSARDAARRHRRWRLAWASAGVAAAAVVVASLVLPLRPPPPATVETPRIASRAAAIVATAAPVAPVILLPGGVAVDANSVAVLPFESAVDDADKSAGELLQNAIVADLAIVPGIYVSSGAAVAPYAQTELSAADIGVQLGTRGIVRGSVEQRASGVRVHAELADAATNRVIWRADYDTTLAGLRSIRTEVVDGIAATLVDPALRRTALAGAASQAHSDNTLASVAEPASNR
ncbi:MAG TPA: hypothetical protein VFX89_23110 [Gammaproteobacteria bacterium]|nr:hypothetical protein [Gammaproteobacteria bacterium]